MRIVLQPGERIEIVVPGESWQSASVCVYKQRTIHPEDGKTPVADLMFVGGAVQHSTYPCPECEGTKMVSDGFDMDECDTCNGTGSINPSAKPDDE